MLLLGVHRRCGVPTRFSTASCTSTPVLGCMHTGEATGAFPRQARGDGLEPFLGSTCNPCISTVSHWPSAPSLRLTTSHGLGVGCVFVASCFGTCGRSSLGIVTFGFYTTHAFSLQHAASVPCQSPLPVGASWYVAMGDAAAVDSVIGPTAEAAIA